jgi:hypothetical protein
MVNLAQVQYELRGSKFKAEEYHQYFEHLNLLPNAQTE